MKCNWCTQQAVRGAKAPRGTVGLLEMFVCETHAYMIEQLGNGYIPMDESEFRQAKIKQMAEQKK